MQGAGGSRSSEEDVRHVWMDRWIGWVVVGLFVGNGILYAGMCKSMRHVCLHADIYVCVFVCPGGFMNGSLCGGTPGDARMPMVAHNLRQIFNNLAKKDMIQAACLVPRPRCVYDGSMYVRATSVLCPSVECSVHTTACPQTQEKTMSVSLFPDH
jgi:hypothetical protein